ncbi:glycosyltransferase family 1 protein [Pseudomonas cavernae]|uniref:Glycosyltransferase family 1 protein n=1 Tax=Pseudomonas cavernae TaxID=2320867 RepID=A0A385Z213_9PSED|nr:glycosyltransferase family 4 protein [Pseudomonas cavernae]AYC33289.1 glycosyltransferase family 1 protein [Pseudomonas cavernae]
MNGLRIARVSTVKFFIFTQLRTQLDAIKESGADLTVVSSAEDDLSADAYDLDEMSFVEVNISRSISPLSDLKALYALVKLFNERRFDIVHSTTPKAGLLCAIAGKMSGVSVRLHTFTGQPWVTMSGVKKHILKWCDKVIGRLNTRCYTDSFSQKQFLVDNGIVKDSRIFVLGEGSLAGIDLQRFNPKRYSEEDRSSLKKDLGIPETSFLILFVGRITRDKGVRELAQAFNQVIAQGVDAHLVFVGPFEVDGRQCFDSVIDENAQQRVRLVGFSREPEKYMSIADVLCLPSYREGFGTVVIEAAAMGVPTIGTDIYGLSDAVVNGETGILVPVRDYQALAQALVKVASDVGIRAEMATKAYKRVYENFDSIYLSRLLVQEYEGLMKYTQGS